MVELCQNQPSAREPRIDCKASQGNPDRKLHPAGVAIRDQRVEETAAVRADLDAEIIAAERAEEGAGAETGLEGQRRVIARRRLVDRRLMSGACVVQQTRGCVDAQPVDCIRRRAAQAEIQRRDIRLRGPDGGDGSGERHRRGVDDGLTKRTGDGRANIDHRDRSRNPCDAEVDGFGIGRGCCAGPGVITRGRNAGAERGRGIGEGEDPGKCLVVRQQRNDPARIWRCQGAGDAGDDPRRWKSSFFVASALSARLKVLSGMLRSEPRPPPEKAVQAPAVDFR